MEMHQLHIAAQEGDLATVKKLIKGGFLGRGAIDIELKSPTGETALHYASKMGHVEVVKYLLEKGANANPKGWMSKTPLHYASSGGYKNIIELLLAHNADLTAKMEYGITPLHLAAEKSQLEATQFLLSKGANINAKMNNLRTPLHEAVANGKIDIVKLLLNKGADSSLKDDDGKTPKDIALSINNDAISALFGDDQKEDKPQKYENGANEHYGIFLFNYGEISNASYGKYVFDILLKPISNCQGTCIFHDGDIHNLQAKQMAGATRELGGRLLQASRITTLTPLVEKNSEFVGGIYMIGVYTTNPVNIDMIHAAFNEPSTEGYIGLITIADKAMDTSTWPSLMKKTLSLLDNVVIVNGKINAGSNRYNLNLY